MQNHYDESRDLFEFYSSLLVSMSPDWIADKGGGHSEVEHRTDEKDYERTILNFDQSNSRGEETFPMIIVELFIKEDDMRVKPNVCIYKKNLTSWDSVLYFPLNDDFVRYKPIESFKKWIKYLVKYRSKRKIISKFYTYLHNSKRKEMQRASQVLMGKRM